MKLNRLAGVVSAVALTVGALAAGGAQAQSLLFWSTQATPLEEGQKMRDLVLKPFGSPVEFQSMDAGPFNTRIKAELQAGKGAIGLIGGLHGEFTVYDKNLVDLSDVAKGLGDVKLNETFAKLGKLGGEQQKYIPWMQATYLMAANKKALEYLPAGADVNALTYDQLIAWGKTLKEKTGGPKIGIPAGPRGLLARFVQGYLYPSFTDSMVTKFRSAEAEKMWGTMKTLWAETNPASTSYNFMQEALLTDEVWVVWDHAARLQEAFNTRPDDFIAFPAPAGPTGRGFMPVIAGIGIPSTAPDQAAAKKLIAHLMQPKTQVETLRATGFFPVVDVQIPDDVQPSVKIEAAAIAKQSTAKDAKPGLLPVGLGDQGGQFNKVYTDTFQRILLANHPIREVLDSQGAQLKAILEKTGAPCWAPDKPSTGACPVE